LNPSSLVSGFAPLDFALGAATQIAVSIGQAAVCGLGFARPYRQICGRHRHDCNALALVDALKRETDIPAVLRAWEPDQIQFGLHLRRQGKLLGDQSQKRYPEPRPA
jgi:hypothetical protein